MLTMLLFFGTASATDIPFAVSVEDEASAKVICTGGPKDDYDDGLYTWTLQVSGTDAEDLLRHAFLFRTGVVATGPTVTFGPEEISVVVNGVNASASATGVEANGPAYEGSLPKWSTPAEDEWLALSNDQKSDVDFYSLPQPNSAGVWVLEVDDNQLLGQTSSPGICSVSTVQLAITVSGDAEAFCSAKDSASAKWTFDPSAYPVLSFDETLTAPSCP